MNIQRWQQIEEIVASAIELPNVERRAFLDEHCGADKDLRREVESLLAQQTDDFLETEQLEQIIETVFDNTESSLIGKQIGNYRILREIGTGGMGAVFLAERADGEFSQKLAVKIIRLGFDSGEIRRRFLHERQILAGLEHPNIARLLDGGTTADNLPFLAMEYVEGAPITKFCRTENLSVPERLKLFLKVCQSVSYAHQHLVVHRDLKPGNIFVTQESDVKLLDFGIAKLLDNQADSKQTQTDFRAFTPDYASPEQIRGEKVTTASDVYSLGVLLYELLTGNLPYQLKGKSFEEISKAILTENPSRPSLSRTNENPESRIPNPKSLAGDLDNITLMALRKEPSRRYASVQQFAEDIERYLNKKPIVARPNTFRYVASKFIGRNKFGVLAAGLILLTLISGVIVSVWQAQRAETQRARAEKRFGEVRKLSSSLLFEIHDSVQNLQGSTPTRQLIVSRALEYLDSLAQEAGDDSGLQIELATAYQKVGDIQGNPYSANLGDTSGALASYQKSVSILENLNNLPTIESQMALGKAYRAVGDILEVEGNVAECMNNYRRSLETFEKLDSQNPNNTAVRDELARAYETLGDGLSRTEDGAAERLQTYQKDLRIRQDLVLQNPPDRKFKRGLATAHLKIGMAMDAKQPEAAENARKSIAILEDLSNSDQTNARARREVGLAYFQLGNILKDAQNFNEALETHRRALAIRQEIAAGDPQNKQAQFDLGASLGEVSAALTNTGNPIQALENAEKSQEIMEKLSKADPDNTIFRRNVGLSYEKSALAFEQAAQNVKLNIAERRRNWEEARDWYQKTRQVFVELKNRDELQLRDDAKIDKFDEKISSCERFIKQR